MTDLLLDPTARSTPSRRAVLGAAWTAPVVVAASTAPAYAASAAASLVFDTLTAYGADYVRGNPTRVQTLVQVRRPWSATAADVTGLTVTVPFPASVAAGGPARAVTGAGWAAGSVTGSAGTAWTYTFTWTGTLDNAWQSTPELSFLVDRTDVARGEVSITAYASAPGATQGTRTISARL